MCSIDDGGRSGVTRVRVKSRSAVVEAGITAILGQRYELVETEPDVVVTDDSDDEWEPAVPVVALTDELSEAPALIRAGARGVLPRDANSAELIAAIEAVTAGLLVLPADQADAMIVRARERTTAALTPRESEVLRMVADGLANKEIAYRLGLAESTIKFHLASVMGKLGAGSRTEAVSIGIRQGIVAI